MHVTGIGLLTLLFKPCSEEEDSFFHQEKEDAVFQGPLSCRKTLMQVESEDPYALYRGDICNKAYNLK